MVVRPWIVVYPIINLAVWISGAFCAKLPYRPLISMLFVEELDQLFERGSVCELRVCPTRSGRRDY